MRHEATASLGAVSGRETDLKTKFQTYHWPFRVPSPTASGIAELSRYHLHIANFDEVENNFIREDYSGQSPRTVTQLRTGKISLASYLYSLNRVDKRQNRAVV